MPAPYDYLTPMGGVQSPMEAFAQSVQLQRAEAERKTALQRKQNMETDLQSLMVNPSPDAFAKFYLKYPEAKEKVEGYRKTISDADNKVIVDTAQEVFLLNRAGKTEDALKVFDTRIEALKNAGKVELAANAERAKRMYEIAPDQQSRESALALTLYNYGGGETYDKILKAGTLDLDTSLIKNVVALGYTPGTPKFQKELRRQMDKVTITRPDGTFIQGTPDEIRSLTIGGVPTKVIPKVTSKEEAMKLPPGTEFIGPDNKPYKVPGGQTGSSPSGNFPGK